MEQKNVDIRRVQDKLLEILLYFKDFCDEHSLSFFLAGGTCLGAVRHHGFIPWDDDLDVFMLRDDYEKLNSLWNKFADKEKYECVRSNEKINIHHTATEIKDCNTTFINRHSVDLDINQGLMIDVIPLDGVSDRSVSRITQIAYSMLYCCFNFQRLPEHKGRLTYYATKIALSVVRSSKTRYKIWKYCEKKLIRYSIADHRFVASFGEGIKIMRQRFPKEWFLDPRKESFEGYEMPVPSHTDEYLRISYGDYMEIPPPEERGLRHDTVFIDLNTSYKKYRGIKYYVQKEVKK